MPCTLFSQSKGRNWLQIHVLSTICQMWGNPESEIVLPLESRIQGVDSRIQEVESGIQVVESGISEEWNLEWNPKSRECNPKPKDPLDYLTWCKQLGFGA